MTNRRLVILLAVAVLVSAYLLASWTDDPATTIGLVVIVATFSLIYLRMRR